MAAVNVMQAYRQKEQVVFSQIPGMTELLHAPAQSRLEYEAQYPDAAFALRISNELFSRDREISIINQTAYFSILNGENISSVQHRHGKDMELYVKRHAWDD